MTKDNIVNCETCAFNLKGSGGAADEVNNRLTGLLCAHSGLPFWCHHAKSGVEYDRGNPLGPMVLPPSERKVCEGWKAFVAELARRGKFRFEGCSPEDRAALLQYGRWLGADALSTLDSYVREKDNSELKEEARKRLEGLVRAVFDVRG